MTRQPLQTKSLIVWLILMSLFGAAAFFSNTFYGWAAFLLCLLLPFVSWLLNRAVRRHCRVSISLPLSSPKRQIIKGSVQIFNDSRLPVRKAVIPVAIVNNLTGEASEYKTIMTLPAGGSSQSSFDFSSEHCGMVSFTIEQIILYDWFGFLPLRAPVSASVRGSASDSVRGSSPGPVQRSGSASASRAVTILPELFSSEIRLNVPYTEPGETDSWYQIKGTQDPNEIFALRQYEKGDPIKRIHWKLSAKRDDLIYKEISQPINQTLLLYWDKTRVSTASGQHEHIRHEDIIDNDGAIMDALAEACASAALAVAQTGVSFTLGWNDTDGYHFEDVTSEEDLLPLIPQLVKSAPTDAANPPGHLTSDAENSVGRFSKVLWFGSAYPFEADPVLPYNTAYLLCSRHDLSVSNRYVIRFAPEEASEALAMFAV